MRRAASSGAYEIVKATTGKERKKNTFKIFLCPSREKKLQIVQNRIKVVYALVIIVGVSASTLFITQNHFPS